MNFKISGNSFCKGVRRHREKKRDEFLESNRTGEPFKHCGAKKRAVNKVKDALPSSPEKKAAVISTLIESPTTRQTLSSHGLSSEEAEIEAKVNSAIVVNA